MKIDNVDPDVRRYARFWLTTPVDLCNGGNGRLDIQPDGAVTVQAESSFAEVQRLTSLDGAWFAR